MELELVRKGGKPDVSTEGELFIDGVHECFTLEDAVRPVKIQDRTAIPAGRYRVVVSFSPGFKRRLPLLLSVPNYSGVRMHRGNHSRHTRGCILVGDDATTLSDDWIGKSEVAELRLVAKLDVPGEHWITIKDAA